MFVARSAADVQQLGALATVLGLLSHDERSVLRAASTRERAAAPLCEVTGAVDVQVPATPGGSGCARGGVKSTATRDARRGRAVVVVDLARRALRAGIVAGGSERTSSAFFTASI